MPARTFKPGIALFGAGALGGGPRGEGIPVLMDLFQRLSEFYEITFYSLTPVATDKIPSSIRVRQLLSFRFPWRLKYFFLFLRALTDHFGRPYSLVFSVSVHPSGPFAIAFGRMVRRPVLVQLIATEAVNLEDIGCEGSTTPYLKKIAASVCNNANILLTVAEYQRQLAIKTLATQRKIDMLPLRVNVKEFTYRKRKISNPVQFIQVGYYSPIKDQNTLFEAFAIVAKQVDCRLTVAGRGFDSAEVDALLSRLEITGKVNRIGFVTQAELRDYYEHAYILLHAARFETGCAVIQEAMASGIGVCGTRVGLLADLGDNYAVVVPSRNPMALAAGILALINDSERYDRTTAAAYDWIKRHDAEWSARGYHAFIDRLMS